MTIEIVDTIDWSQTGTVVAPRARRSLSGVAGRCSVCGERITLLDSAGHDVAQICDVCHRAETTGTTLVMTTAQYALVERAAQRRGQTPVMVLRDSLGIPATEPVELVLPPSSK